MARCKRIRTLGGVGLACLSLLALTPPAIGADAAPQARVARIWLAQGEVSLKQAVRIAQQAYGGEVVKADEVVLQGQRRFQIRLVNNGRMRDVLVDAATGQILNP